MKIEEEIQQSKFRNVHHKVAVNLLYTAAWLDDRNKNFFKEYGITNQQFNILRILRGQLPNKISGAEIKNRMLDKNSDVSRLLDRLVLKKLVTKNQCPKDKRAVDVLITEPGLALLKKIDGKMDENDLAVFHLTKTEATQLSDLLDKCRG
ncbi:MAG: MarR family transcriptional regulator [Cytophagales bacterium]|jgi:DNA-binding MarR family transcriptional regulator|nr:MarR family transcriptional regulator [Cytophagales bacterium]MCA6366381.1 MarR family transcriptional regulator [Cytophagales bacterium]MCA6371180.1 MarR family transcriptional regulator [Cytophagales bacterium]MCA6374695.1 MarR family transcriptional regulator [Cytophagales bacterium]MCA6384564.1 MarR family transcriptional regulator [Cytophagales bacterium]